MSKQLLWTLLVRGMLIAAGLISSVVTARFLGPEGRGTFFYWATLAAFAIQFGNLGLHSSNTYYLAKGLAPLSALAANSLWVSLIGGAVLGGGLLLFLWLTNVALHDKWALLLPALIMIPSGLYFMLGTNLLVAEGLISQYNGFEIANRYLALAAALFSAWYWATPEALLLAVGLLAALMCLPLYAYLRKLGRGGGANLKLLRSSLGYAMRAYLVATLAFFVLRMNAVLLETYTDPTTLGLWSIAAQIIDVIIVIPNTAALVLLPRIIRSDQPYQLMQPQLRMMSACLALVCVAAVWLGRDVILLVYGDRFEPAYSMLLWGLPGAFALGLTSILSQYLASVGMPLAVVWVWFIGLVVESACALWWVPKYGGEGAMASLSVAYSVVLGLAWRLAAYCKR